MFHTGYIRGDITPIGYTASGVPVGLGGVLRMHPGEHWRIGGEGYVSVLRQLGNGSYVKTGWGGILGDFYWTFGKTILFAELTIGGGTITDYLMMEAPESEWKPVGEAYFHKQPFFSLTPSVGCEFIITKTFHLTVKTDCLFGFGRNLYFPTGPRFFFGFIFYHGIR